MARPIFSCFFGSPPPFYSPWSFFIRLWSLLYLFTSWFFSVQLIVSLSTSLIIWVNNRRWIQDYFKGVEENLSEDEKSILESENGIASSGHGGSGQAPNLSGALAQLIGAASSETGMDLNQADFLKLLASSKPSQDSSLKLVSFENFYLFSAAYLRLFLVLISLYTGSVESRYARI